MDSSALSIYYKGTKWWEVWPNLRTPIVEDGFDVIQMDHCEKVCPVSDRFGSVKFWIDGGVATFTVHYLNQAPDILRFGWVNIWMRSPKLNDKVLSYGLDLDKLYSIEISS